MFVSVGFCLLFDSSIATFVAMSTTFQGAFVTIGERLREERKRLKMTQAEFAVAGGIGVSALKLYENSDRDAGSTFLSAIASEGADVQYILTGTRSSLALGADEQVLLDGFRDLDQATKKRLLAFVLTESGPVAIRKKIKEKSAEHASSTASAKGKNAVAINGDGNAVGNK